MRRLMATVPRGGRNCGRAWRSRRGRYRARQRPRRRGCCDLRTDAPTTSSRKPNHGVVAVASMRPDPIRRDDRPPFGARGRERLRECCGGASASTTGAMCGELLRVGRRLPPYVAFRRSGAERQDRREGRRIDRVGRDVVDRGQRARWNHAMAPRRRWRQRRMRPSDDPRARSTGIDGAVSASTATPARRRRPSAGCERGFDAPHAEARAEARHDDRELARRREGHRDEKGTRVARTGSDWQGVPFPASRLSSHRALVRRSLAERDDRATAVARVLVDERCRGRVGTCEVAGPLRVGEVPARAVALEAGEPVASQHVARDLERRELDHQVDRFRRWVDRAQRLDAEAREVDATPVGSR